MVLKNANSRVEKTVAYGGASALTNFANSSVVTRPYVDATSKYGVYEGNSNIFLYELFDKYTVGTSFDQLSKHQLYGRGHYFMNNLPGVKAVLEDGSVQLELLDNESQDWIIIADGHYIGPVTLFYLSKSDTNNSYHRLTLDIQGPGVYVIGSSEVIETFYIGLHSIFTAKELSFCRYKTYVHAWNEIIHNYGSQSMIGSALSAESGNVHHSALLQRYDKNHVPPFVRFSDANAEEFDKWADSLESGLVWAITEMFAQRIDGSYVTIPEEFAPYMLQENRAKLFTKSK